MNKKQKDALAQRTGAGNPVYRERARKGGLALVAKYGPEHMSRNGKRGGMKLYLKHGPDYFRNIRKGGPQNVT